MICFTEQQKQEIEQLGEFVIEFKRRILNTGEALTKAFAEIGKALSALAQWALRNTHAIQKCCLHMEPKKKYKMVRRLDKCGFTEKEINLMVGGTHHCRNNC